MPSAPPCRAKIGFQNCGLQEGLHGVQALLLKGLTAWPTLESVAHCIQQQPEICWTQGQIDSYITVVLGCQKACKEKLSVEVSRSNYRTG